MENVQNIDIKNLTLKDMKRELRKLDEKIEGEVSINGVPYKIKIDKIFKKTKEYSLLGDLIKFLNFSLEKQEFLELSSPYISLLFIKHFTSIDVPDDVDKALEVMNLLIDLDLFSQVLELMPEEQVKEVADTIDSSMMKMTENIEDSISELENNKDKIQNKEVLKLIE